MPKLWKLTTSSVPPSYSQKDYETTKQEWKRTCPRSITKRRSISDKNTTTGSTHKATTSKPPSTNTPQYHKSNQLSPLIRMRTTQMQVIRSLSLPKPQIQQSPPSRSPFLIWMGNSHRIWKNSLLVQTDSVQDIHPILRIGLSWHWRTIWSEWREPRLISTLMSQKNYKIVSSPWNNLNLILDMEQSKGTDNSNLILVWWKQIVSRCWPRGVGRRIRDKALSLIFILIWNYHKSKRHPPPPGGSWQLDSRLRMWLNLSMILKAIWTWGAQLTLGGWVKHILEVDHSSPVRRPIRRTNPRSSTVSNTRKTGSQPLLTSTNLLLRLNSRSPPPHSKWQHPQAITYSHMSFTPLGEKSSQLMDSDNWLTYRKSRDRKINNYKNHSCEVLKNYKFKL